MAAELGAAHAAPAPPPAPRAAEVRIWDPLVRVFHWSLVAAFATAFVTGDHAGPVHVWAGYGVLALVAIRLIWGVAGTRHARFASFVAGPRAVLSYLRGVARGHAPRFLGHNPAGGWMIVTLIATLLLTGGSGWIALHKGSHLWEEIHETFANLTLVLIGVHVAGVVVSSLVHRENLVRAMITGRKRVDAGA